MTLTTALTINTSHCISTVRCSQPHTHLPIMTCCSSFWLELHLGLQYYNYTRCIQYTPADTAIVNSSSGSCWQGWESRSIQV